jgi:exosortase
MTTSGVSHPASPGLARRTMFFGAYTFAVCAVFVVPIRALVRLAISNPTASHIVLVPFISIALIVMKRERVFASVRSAWRPGVATAIIALLVMLAGGQAPNTDVSLQVRVAGLVGMWLAGFLACYGSTAFRSALFPLLFLLFTVPMPTAVLDMATQFLKVGSTELVALLFTATGTTFHREGFTFLLPRFSIEVADQCSGIRSSLALMLTTLVAGYLFLDTIPKRTVLLLAIVPVVIVKNAVRIVTVTLLATYVNPGFLTGRLHHDGGVVFFLMGLGLLAPVLALLSRGARRPSPGGTGRPISL